MLPTPRPCNAIPVNMFAQQLLTVQLSKYAPLGMLRILHTYILKLQNSIYKCLFTSVTTLGSLSDKLKFLPLHK